MSTALEQMSGVCSSTLFIGVHGDHGQYVAVPVYCVCRHDDADYGVFMVSGIECHMAGYPEVQRAFNENNADLLFRGNRVRLVKSLNDGILLINSLVIEDESESILGE